MSRHATAVLMLLGMAALPTATAIAGVGGLSYMKAPPAKVAGTMRCFSFGTFAKAADPNAAGLARPDALVATARRHGVVLSVAVDARDPGGKPYQVLRFDPTGRARFHNAIVVPMTPMSAPASRDRHEMRIDPPATIQVLRGGRRMPVTVSGQFWIGAGGRPEFAATLVCGAEGPCAFGEAVRTVRVVDGDGNLSLGDPVPDIPRDADGRSRLNDYFWVADARGRFTGPKLHVGEIMRVEGTWYTVKLDDLTASAEPVKAATGMLKIDRPRWEAELKGRKHRLHLRGKAVPLAVPADTYTLVSYVLHAPGGPGGKGLRVTGYRSRPFVVAAGRTTKLPAPLAMVCKMTARQRGRDVVLTVGPTDKCGRQGASVVDAAGRQVKRPAIEILDRSGKVVHVARMEYG
jgi:hypothetical protein